MYHVENPSLHLSAPPSVSSARSGRSAPRSRTGCRVCKERRVRCDEAHPVCSNCSRLKLDCFYQTRPRKKARISNAPVIAPCLSENHHHQHRHDAPNSIAPTHHQSTQEHVRGNSSNSHQRPLHESGAAEGLSWPGKAHPYNPTFLQQTQRSLPDSRKLRSTIEGNNQRQDLVDGSWKWPNFTSSAQNVELFDFTAIGAFDAPNPENVFGTLMEFADTPWHSPPAMAKPFSDQLNLSKSASNTPDQSLASAPTSCTCEAGRAPAVQAPGPSSHERSVTRELRRGTWVNEDKEDDRSQFLLSYFHRIVQPPASILVSGIHKWRRLQNYLVRIGDNNRAVANALFAVIEVLANEEVNGMQNGSMENALDRHDSARKEIEFELSRLTDSDQRAKDHLLAAIFLLAWFEVIRDQIADQSLFPTGLADRIITCSNSWNSKSLQLLAWLNTLDSKATHLGGHHLLSPASLQVVSQHPTQISTSDGSDDEEEGHEGHESPEEPMNHSSASSHPFSPAQTSHPHHHASSPECSQPRGTAGPNLRQMKQIMLNTILQPALEWYLTTQAYNRRISSLDRHHRSRGSVKDEYEVITASKQLETELFKLWRQRPMVITLSAAQLSKIVAADVALRLEEIFSIYLASFWILFVFLHRVSWWALPHSETVQGALEESWQSMLRCNCEVVNGGQKKIVHPALLWPLFLFGSECTMESRRNWAIDQLEALGEAKPVIGEDDADDVLPPFRLSAGATRNSKRAALLLRELIKRQIETGGRVDDRDLSVELFGCHFSII